VFKVKKEDINDNLIKRLGKITYSIKIIYDKITIHANKPIELQKDYELLDALIEIENRVYKEIGDRFLDELFINRIRYLFNKEYKDGDILVDRIYNYVGNIFYLNPYKTTEYNPVENEIENQISIESQVCMDYEKALLLNIDEEMSNTKSKKYNKKLMRVKNQILFSQKIVSNLIKSERTNKIDGRQRCIIFNQDEKTTDKIYENFAYEQIRQIIEKSISGKYDMDILEIELKSNILLLTDDEKLNLANCSTTIAYLYSAYPNIRTIERVLNETRNNLIAKN
jgi:hypothetical protein